MKKSTLILVSILFLSGCNTAKKVEKTISKGDYDRAIEISIKKLRKNKQSKRKQKYILLLEEAFAKAVDRDLDNLRRFEKDSNPAIIEQIYETYVMLDERQESIKPVLPLHLNSKNREIDIKIVNYLDKINASKATLSDYLYKNTVNLLSNNTIETARKAYEGLSYLNEISPNFKDVNKLLEKAHFMGTNFVLVRLENQTNQIIPMRLEQDLLDFNAYGLDRFWTVFHSQKQDKIDYNFNLALLFKRIDVSPERISEKEILLEKEVKEGKEYMVDSDGHIVKDSLGNSIKIDKYITVKSKYFEIHQEKACHIATEVVLMDKAMKELESFPLESEFVFINDFAEFDGDKRALNATEMEMINKREVPFPYNEQMILDTGQDIKEKLKSIIDDLDI